MFFFLIFRKLGWRHGLQSVTGALSVTFFLGLIYRSASLYHPQRRAIVHLKNQKSKLREKKSTTKAPQRLVDLRPLSCRPVRMLMLAAGSAAFGLYTPAFYIVSTYFSIAIFSFHFLFSNCLSFLFNLIIFTSFFYFIENFYSIPSSLKFFIKFQLFYSNFNYYYFNLISFYLIHLIF